MHPIAFAAVDWWILLVYILVATLPGFVCRKYIRGQEDFLIAGRSLSVYLATASLAATEMGLITVIYMAQMGFVNGLSGMMLGVIAAAATMFVGLTGFMVRGLRASGVTTVAEYYQKRYSTGVRLLGGLIIATAGILNYGVFLRPEADFVRLITQIPDLSITAVNTPGAVPIFISSIKLAMVLLIVLVLLYTMLGGMVSVTLTNYVRFIILAAGMALVTWWVCVHPDVGGFKGILAAVKEHRPGYGLNPFATQALPAGNYLGLGLIWVLWQCMLWTGTNTWQTQAFRTAATDSPRTAKMMWTLTGVNYFGRAVIPMLWGVAALAYFSHKGGLEGIDSVQAMPLFLTHLPEGLLGLLLACMLAAFMSTHSGYLLAWSGVLTEDLVAPLCKRLLGWELKPFVRIWITRFFILCLAAWLLYWGLWFKPQSTIWNYLSVTGTMYFSGAAALVAMGLYWKRANTRGAYLGLLGGALPGLVYLTLRIAALAVEPAMREADHVCQTGIAKLSVHFYEPYMGFMSFPLALLGMYLGSLWGERANDKATGPRIGTGSFMAAGGA